MTFEEWLEERRFRDNFLHHKRGVWNYQQERIDLLEEDNTSLKEAYTKLELKLIKIIDICKENK